MMRSRKLRDYHEWLFAWHCETFFPLRDYLSRAEQHYLSACFALAQDYDERAVTGAAHFSYYTYSHRVRSDSVNSSRFAYGSLGQPAAAWRAAQAVLAERGVELDPFWRHGDPVRFYGLGWDLLAEHFKVYLHVTDLSRLPADMTYLKVSDVPVLDEGLVSFTYRQGACVEEKVYLYPRAFASGERRALMNTNLRGCVEQEDVGDSAAWRAQLNPAGRHIVDRYAAIGEPLDTVAYTGPDDFTLYFP